MLESNKIRRTTALALGLRADQSWREIFRVLGLGAPGPGLKEHTQGEDDVRAALLSHHNQHRLWGAAPNWAAVLWYYWNRRLVAFITNAIVQNGKQSWIAKLSESVGAGSNPTLDWLAENIAATVMSGVYISLVPHDARRRPDWYAPEAAAMLIAHLVRFEVQHEIPPALVQRVRPVAEQARADPSAFLFG